MQWKRSRHGKSLGVNTRAVTLISMGIGSLTAAVAVSFVGIINFVGLVAPHIMRGVCRQRLPVSDT